MRLTIVLLTTLGALMPSSTTIAAEQDLTGRYTMEGTSLRPNSRSYAGECELKRTDQVYEVHCINTHSGDKYVGKGIQRSDLFSLSLGEYLIVYRVSPAGRMDGNWANVRSNDYGRETLTPK